MKLISRKFSRKWFHGKIYYSYLAASRSWSIRKTHRSSFASSSWSNGKKELKSSWVILALTDFLSFINRSKMFSNGQICQNWIVLIDFTEISRSIRDNFTDSLESKSKSWSLGKIFFRYPWALGQFWIKCIIPLTTADQKKSKIFNRDYTWSDIFLKENFCEIVQFG